MHEKIECREGLKNKWVPHLKPPTMSTVLVFLSELTLSECSV